MTLLAALILNMEIDMSITRRTFLGGTALAAAGSTLRGPRARGAEAAEGESPGRQTGERPLFISTWPFGKEANDASLASFERKGSLLDAVEDGIRQTESSGNPSVGLSGRPNAAGFVQLDACIHWGPDHKAGSVAGLEGIRHPITAARRVMEKTPHVMLVGEGARWFALEEGLEAVELPADRGKAWREERAKRRGPPEPGEKNHDTIALLGLGPDGNIGGGCSTSGLAGKLPGRVGDSPIIGSGLYVDNDVGAAGATGVGENVMRYCATFMIVEHMRQGMSPEEACVEAIRRITRKDAKKGNLNINFIALDKQGRYGAAGTDDFAFAVAFKGSSAVLKARRVV